MIYKYLIFFQISIIKQRIKIAKPFSLKIQIKSEKKEEAIKTESGNEWFKFEKKGKNSFFVWIIIFE